MNCLSASGFNHIVRDPDCLASHDSSSERLSVDKKVPVTCITKLKKYIWKEKICILLDISYAKLWLCAIEEKQTSRKKCRNQELIHVSFPSYSLLFCLQFGS